MAHCETDLDEDVADEHDEAVVAEAAAFDASDFGLTFASSRKLKRYRHLVPETVARAVRDEADEVRRSPYSSDDAAADADLRARLHFPYLGDDATRTSLPLPIDPELLRRLPLVVCALQDPSETARQEREWHMGHPEWTIENLRRTLPHHIDRSCVLCGPDGVIYGVFVTSDTDPALLRVAAAMRAHMRELDRSKALPLKPSKYWYSGNQKGHRHEIKARERVAQFGYWGENWLDGIQAFPTKLARSGMVTAFYGRKPDSACEDAFARHAVLMQALECKHCPQLGAHRIALAEAAAMPSIVPGLSARDCAASMWGLSRSFACKPHIDTSSRNGTTESIFWCNRAEAEAAPAEAEAAPAEAEAAPAEAEAAPAEAEAAPAETKGRGDVDLTAFAILPIGALFYIGRPRACALYLPQHLLHGTCPNASSRAEYVPHGGLGSVLVTKKRRSAPTHLQRSIHEHLARFAFRPRETTESEN